MDSFSVSLCKYILKKSQVTYNLTLYCSSSIFVLEKVKNTDEFKEENTNRL